MAWKPIKIKSLFIQMSSSKSSLRFTTDDIDETLESMKQLLTKRKNDYTDENGNLIHKDKSRVFYVTLKGGIGEVWEDDMPVEKQPTPDLEDEI